MTENVENLILELLRGMRSDLTEVKEVLREHGLRLNRIETGVAGLRRDQAGDAEAIALVQAQVDRLREEIERIKRRLELTP